MAGFKRFIWQFLHGRWRGPRQAAEPGYSVLAPVPGDLPVFLEIALKVLQGQDSEHRLETLVIPDVVTPRIHDIVERVRPTWPGELRLIEMPWPDRLLPRYVNRPHHNHWLQLINGAECSRGRYAVLHDADLFITDRGFLRRQYERSIASQMACYGVHRVWDPWFEAHGYSLAATWEMYFDIDWLRSFPPHLHLGHDNVLNGARHTFDTTLYPQALTAPERIGFSSDVEGLIHFNYVICSYRYYLAAPHPYEDEHFRILLIRLLIDVFDPSSHYDLPAIDELATGLHDGRARITYTKPATRSHYPEFREKFQRLITSGLLDHHQAEIAASRLERFDRHFDWPAVSATTSA